MFEDLIKQIESLNQQTVSVPIEADEMGYIDKQCPSEDCGFLFKVNEEDWKNIFRDESVSCPFCGHRAPADQWYTIEQVEHAKAEALAFAEGKIDSALRYSAQKFNRNQSKGGFISISMNVKGEQKRTYTIPAAAAEAMQLEVLCDKCSARFAVIGSAYFCPACGHNSANRTFCDSLRKIRAKLENLELVRKAFIDVGKKDDAELTCRSLIESSIQDGVMALQRLCEGLYEPYNEIKKAPFNVFQRLQQGSQLWEDTVGVGYSKWLSEIELVELNILYQKRHLLSHNEGIVDENYITRSGDQTYKIGQRIIVPAKDVENLLRSLDKLGDGLIEVVNKLRKQ